MIQRPRGTRDFPPDEAFRRAVVRERMARVMERWGYQEIGTPTFEHLELFTQKSGPGVLEEIYSFKDKGGRDLALRPELTAPVMRMYVSEMQNVPRPLRLYYYGNCFRYERPQKGRFREFWQLGCELIGGRRADSEAEVISLAQSVTRSVGIKGDLHIGYLGLIRTVLRKLAAEDRPAIMRMIDKKERKPLAERLEAIGADHLGLLELIDSKGRLALDRAAEMAEVLEKMPNRDGPASPIPSAASEGARSSAREGRAVEAELGLPDFEETISLLDGYGVDYTIDFEIVRGLEYYTGTVFEMYASGLGAQSQICGGGTYELISLLGGAQTPSTGFGLGFDRILEVVTGLPPRRPPLVMAFTPQVRKEALAAARQLRESTAVVTDVMGRGLGLSSRRRPPWVQSRS